MSLPLASSFTTARIFFYLHLALSGIFMLLLWALDHFPLNRFWLKISDSIHDFEELEFIALLLIPNIIAMAGLVACSIAHIQKFLLILCLTLLVITDIFLAFTVHFISTFEMPIW